MKVSNVGGGKDALQEVFRLRADYICPSIQPSYHGLTYVTAVGEYDKVIVPYRRALEYFKTNVDSVRTHVLHVQ